jgi:colanic acid biosynthesis glycosyl transferase WcaI
VRISIYSYNYAPEPTGIPYFNTSMAEWLARRSGWSVTVHTGIPHYPWWRIPDEYISKNYRGGKADEMRNGVKVERVAHYVPSAPVTGAKRMRLDASYVWAVLLRSFRTRVRPNVIIIVAPPFLGGLLGLFLGWRWRVPVVYHVQDLQIDVALDLGMINRHLGKLLLTIERIILTHVDLLTSVSEGMLRRLAQKVAGRKRPVSFPNWAEVESIRPHVGANQFRLKWGIPEGDVLVFYSGNLGRKQGLEILIQALALLVDRTRIHGVIAGAGAEADALRDYVRDMGMSRLKIVPLISAVDLAEFLSAADIHCIPQRRIVADLVMPSKLLNIMAVSRPVVATVDPGTELHRIISQAGCGLCVTPESPVELATAIGHLADNRGLRERHGCAGRSYVESRLSIDHVLNAFADHLDDLVRPIRSKRIAESIPPSIDQTTSRIRIGVS